MHWYYTINRERFGPVDERAIRSLISTGKLAKTDFVWNETMGDSWKTAGEVFSSLFAGTIRGPMNHRKPGQRMSNAEITADARAALSGRWGIAIGGLIIYIILMFAVSFIAGMIPFIGNFAELFLLPPLIIGLMSFLLSLARQEGPAIEQLFSGFQRYWPGIGAYCLAGLFMTLWMIPGIVLILLGLPFVPEFGVGQQLPQLPIYLTQTMGTALFAAGFFVTWLTGVIVSLRYSQIYFVLADDYSAGALDSIRTSIQLMQGNKWKLVFLGLRFFGWFLLSMLTFGIGLIWVYPYMLTAFACFYDDLKD